MNYLSVLLRKAAPPDSLSQPVYFHGSMDSFAAPSILELGLKGNPTQGKGKLAPVKDMVYLTPDFEYAMIYALGGVLMGHKTQEEYSNELKYGYIYTIPKKNLKDVNPDEDSIGKLVYDSLRTGNSDFLWLVRLAEKFSTPKQIQGLKEGIYAEFAMVGKKLVKKLTDAQKIQILTTGAHIAHNGSVLVSGAYILRRDHSEVLTGNINKDTKYMIFVTNSSDIEKAKELLNTRFK